MPGAAFAFACISQSKDVAGRLGGSCRCCCCCCQWLQSTGKYASFAWGKTVSQARALHFMRLAATLPCCLAAWLLHALPMRHSLSMQCNNSFAYKWFSFAHLNAIHLHATCHLSCCLSAQRKTQSTPRIFVYLLPQRQLLRNVCVYVCVRASN